MHIERLWKMTQSLNVLHPEKWAHLAIQILDSYTQEVYDAKIILDNPCDKDAETQWKFGEALLYSITVITTIGQFYYLVA